MALREATYYTVVCEWPGCGAGADEDTEYSAWADPGSAYDSAVNAGWHKGVGGDEDYCTEHPLAHQDDEGRPKPPYLLVLEDDVDRVCLITIERVEPSG